MSRIFQVRLAAFILVLALTASPALSKPCKVTSSTQEAAMTANRMPQLSAEEQKIVTELNDKYRPLMMAQRSQLTAKRTELQAVMAQETFEADKAKSLSQEITTLHSKLMELRMAKQIEMRQKGIAYSATCATKRRQSGPCAIGAGMKGSGCKGINVPQCPKNKPCKL